MDFADFEKKYPTAAPKFKNFLASFEASAHKLLTDAMLEACQKYADERSLAVTEVLDSIRNAPMFPKELVAELSARPESEVREAIWKLLSDGTAEISPDLKIQVRDTRAPEVRMWDEALALFYGNHAGPLASKIERNLESSEDGVLIHIKSCQTCLPELQEHAQSCADAALLIAKLDSL